MLLLNVALRHCRLPRESQVLIRLDPTGEDWTRTKISTSHPSDMAMQLGHNAYQNNLAQKFIPEAVLKVRPHAVPPCQWDLPSWGDRLALDSTTCKGDSCHTFPQEILSLSGSPQVLLVYAADGTASQGEDNDLSR